MAEVVALKNGALVSQALPEQQRCA